MNPHKTLFLGLAVSVACCVPALAGGHHSGSHGSSGTVSAGSAGRPSSGGQVTTFRSGPNVRYTGARMITPSQRYSSIQRGTTISQRRITPGTFNQSHVNHVTRLENNRARNITALQNHRENHPGALANRNRGLANNSQHVFARRSASNWHRDWDRHHDHWWNGHRCHFANGSWIIFDLGFFPWYGYPYDYYGYYGSYPYAYNYNAEYQDDYGDNSGYDQNVYEGTKPPADYTDDKGNGYYYDSSNPGTDSTVVALQQKLSRAGYYRGEIDGVLGPETRRAIVRYQSNNGLRTTDR